MNSPFTILLDSGRTPFISTYLSTKFVTLILNGLKFQFHLLGWSFKIFHWLYNWHPDCKVHSISTRSACVAVSFVANFFKIASTIQNFVHTRLASTFIKELLSRSSPTFSFWNFWMQFILKGWVKSLQHQAIVATAALEEKPTKSCSLEFDRLFFNPFALNQSHSKTF